MSGLLGFCVLLISLFEENSIWEENHSLPELSATLLLKEDPVPTCVDQVSLNTQSISWNSMPREVCNTQW